MAVHVCSLRTGMHCGVEQRTTFAPTPVAVQTPASDVSVCRVEALLVQQDAAAAELASSKADCARLQASVSGGLGGVTCCVKCGFVAGVAECCCACRATLFRVLTTSTVVPEGHNYAV